MPEELDKWGLPPAGHMSTEDFLAKYPPREESLPPVDLNAEIIRHLRATAPAECKAMQRTGEIWPYCRQLREACARDAHDRMARGQRESEAWRLAIRTVIHEMEED